MNRFLLVLAIFTGFTMSLFASNEKAFEPFSKEEKSLYKFQLDKILYKDENQMKSEMEKLRQISTDLEKKKGSVIASAKDLLDTMELQRKIADLQEALYAYAHFRKSINSDDKSPEEAQQKLDAEIQSKISFVKVELKAITQDTLTKFISERPELKKYDFILNDYVRMAPHTLNEDKESLLSSLVPDLIQWQENSFQSVFDRHSFPKIKSGEKEYDVYIDFDALLKNPDQKIRETTFKTYYDFFKDNADLLAFSLRQLIKTLNSLAKIRGFSTYFDEALFERYLSRGQLDSLYKQIEEGLPLYHKYQQFRIDTLKADYNLPDTNIWDYDIQPKSAKEIRLTIGETTDLLNNAMKVLGASYSYELGRLLDPKNGRLDIVSGLKRGQGAYCISNFGFFSSNFQGFLDDISTMIHESGHVMHYQFVKNNLGSGIFAEGPNYMTESFAMFNEALLREQLLKTLKDPLQLASLRWDIVSERMYMWELARRAKFEMCCYDQMAKDQIKDEKDFNKICSEVGKQYDVFFQKHPEALAYHWMRKHHYWEVPTYYVNYVFANILALKYLELFKADPTGFPPKYLAMVSSGFDRPPTKLLKDFLNIDFEDPAMFKGVQEMIQKEFDELQTAMKK
ncbi:MAG: M3 family oligoendopeptidase [Candidatus Riflebacteria bacterium]|nr:M3 family oligoendopeptidase [Candidatus Riflebacteria bacterium]